MYPYATVSDVRTAGVTVAQASDELVESLLENASEQVEQYTQQFFSARRYEAALDGCAHATLNLNVPIIELESVAVRSTSASRPDSQNYALEDVVVYDRDRSRGQVTGDTGAPRLRLRTDVFWSLGLDGFEWPLGEQNVLLLGTWGWTEPRFGYVDTAVGPFALVDGDDLQLRIDGEVDATGAPIVRSHAFASSEFTAIGAATVDEVAIALSRAMVGLAARGRFTTSGRVARLQSAQKSFSSRVEVIGGTAVPKLGLDAAVEVYYPHGETPSAITEATVLLVKRALGIASSGGADPGDPGPVKSQRTRSQDVTFAVDSGVNQHLARGSLTGDPTIDAILVRYRRRPQVYVPRGRRRERPYL